MYLCSWPSQCWVSFDMFDVIQMNTLTLDIKYVWIIKMYVRSLAVRKDKITYLLDTS